MKSELREQFDRELKASGIPYSDEWLYSLVLDLRKRVEELEKTKSDGK